MSPSRPGGPPGRQEPGGVYDDAEPDDPSFGDRYDDYGSAPNAGEGEGDDDYGEDPDDHGWPIVDGPPPRRPGPRRRHPVLMVLAILAVILLLVVAGGLIWVHSQIDPGGHRGPDISVVIPSGASTTQIGDRLASAGIIHDGSLFAIYVRLRSEGPLYPGTYELPKNSTYTQAIDALKAGPKILTENLVIPEGFTVAQIADAVGALPHLGLSARKFLAAADSGTVRSPYEPAGVDNLEGLLFPATYQVRAGETEVDVLEEMIGTFDDRMSALGLSTAATKLGMTPYQVITVASIVEREAKLAVDRPNVASAIYNRLRIGMTLGADSTQTYYLRLTDPALDPSPEQLDQPSPYNTRRNKGLPPTPISDPGTASLQAAAAPPKTSYLYFVEVNPDGQLGFATDEAGFENLRHQCQTAGLC